MLFTQDTNTNPPFKPLYINITKKRRTTQEKLSVKIQTFRPRRVRRDRFSLTLLSTHTREKPCFQSLWFMTIVKDLKVCPKQNTLKHSYQRETILSIIVVNDIVKEL